jgi:hypothetical protein
MRGDQKVWLDGMELHSLNDTLSLSKRSLRIGF